LLPATGSLCAAEPVRRPVDFEADVRPILAASCYPCHGPQTHKSEFRLDRKADALKGGENGIAIVPGKSADSPMILRVSGKGRAGGGGAPKKERPRLPAERVAPPAAWTDGGGKWRNSPATTSEKPHWAYQPIDHPAVPTARVNLAVRNPIDAFILAKLAEKG